jgi:hypothetical protein
MLYLLYCAEEQNIHWLHVRQIFDKTQLFALTCFTCCNCFDVRAFANVRAFATDLLMLYLVYFLYLL